MPPFRTLPQAQPDPFAGANMQAMANLASSITKIKQQRRRRELQTGILNVVATGGGKDEIAKYLEGQQQTPEQQPGVGGFFGRLVDRFNPMTPSGPGTTGLEQGFTGGLLKDALSRKRGDQGAKTSDLKALDKHLNTIITDKETGGTREPTKSEILILERLADKVGMEVVRTDRMESQRIGEFWKPEKFEKRQDVKVGTNFGLREKGTAGVPKKLGGKQQKSTSDPLGLGL